MKNLFKALANFQNEVPVIHQDTKGFNYTYSNLNTIFKVIKPLLQKNGLMFTQPLNNGKLKTIIVHVESGETLESEIDLIDGVSLNKMNDFQVMGSQITYLRRYSLSSILGLITDKDIDAQGTKSTPKRSKEVLTLKHQRYNGVIKSLKEKTATIEQIQKVFTIDAKLLTELKAI